MSNKKIIEQTPGKIIYESDHIGQVLCFFDDLCVCPVTGETKEMPGKGVLANHIAAVLGSKLGGMGIPHGHISVRNLKESSFVSGLTLPFSLKMHLVATPDIMEQFDLSGHVNFDPPLIEYRTHSQHVHATEDFLVAMGWTDHEEMEDIQALACRTIHCLQGLLAAWDMSLMQVQLNLLRTDDDDLIIGGIWPEMMVVKDQRNHKIWYGLGSESVEALMDMYTWFAQRIGISSEFLPAVAGELTPSHVGSHNINEEPLSTWPSNVLPFAPLRPDHVG